MTRAIASPSTFTPPRPRPLPAVRSGSNAPDSLPLPRLRLRRPPPTCAPRRLMPPPPAAAAASAASDGAFRELSSAADFAAIASPGGRISVAGFGSLLSERSARSTFPELENFRVAALRGFRRVFAHAAPIFFERGIAIEATKEFSSLSVEPCEGELIIVTVFEIKEDEVPSFIEREHEFRFLAVVPEGLDGVPFSNPAVVCARYSDEEYFQERCKGSKEIYNQRYGRFNIDKIWRDDILPCRLYLRHWVAVDPTSRGIEVERMVAMARRRFLALASGLQRRAPAPPATAPLQGAPHRFLSSATELTPDWRGWFCREVRGCGRR